MFRATLDIVKDVFGHPRVLGMLSTITRIDPEEFWKFRKKLFFYDFFSHFGSWRIDLDRSPYCLGGVLGRKIVVLRAQEELWDHPLHR